MNQSSNAALIQLLYNRLDYGHHLLQIIDFIIHFLLRFFYIYLAVFLILSRLVGFTFYCFKSICLKTLDLSLASYWFPTFSRCKPQMLLFACSFLVSVITHDRRCVSAGTILPPASTAWTSSSFSSARATASAAAADASRVWGYSTGWPRTTRWSGSRSSTRVWSSTRPRTWPLKSYNYILPLRTYL